MLALVSFLIVILFSLFVVRIGAIALEATGISSEIARFQAHSAFSGVGFTTSEAEMLMSNPQRRKILRFLMLMGSAGLTSALATLILTFMQATGTVHLFGFEFDSLAFTLASIIVSLLILLAASRTRIFDDSIRWLLKHPLHLMRSKMALYDYEMILGLSQGNSIVSFQVPKNHWMVNETIGELKLEKEGVVVLGVFRRNHAHEHYIASPSNDFQIKYRDRLVVYAREDVAANLAKREKGKVGSLERKEAEELHKSAQLAQKVAEQKAEKK